MHVSNMVIDTMQNRNKYHARLAQLESSKRRCQILAVTPASKSELTEDVKFLHVLNDLKDGCTILYIVLHDNIALHR